MQLLTASQLYQLSIGVWRPTADGPQLPRTWQASKQPRQLTQVRFSLQQAASLASSPAGTAFVKGLKPWQYHSTIRSAGASVLSTLPVRGHSTAAH